MTIQPLPSHIIDRIAAGEVIDSLAAVVRELVENSLDAGAERIRIEVWPEQWRVRVADNGQGLEAADLAQAALPHSTSKFQGGAGWPGLARFKPTSSAQASQVEEGWGQIRSLGFRGEALHSLAQLASLEICSRWAGTGVGDATGTMTGATAGANTGIGTSEAEASEGWRACYGAGGKLTKLERLAIAPGTIVTVSDLFSAWPARRQALPHAAQQLRQIQRLIQHMALTHPQVTWSLGQSDRDWFSLWPGPSAQAILPQILRGVVEADLREVRVERSPIEATTVAPAATEPDPSTLMLLLGLPDRCHRHRPDWIKVAVNGRCINLPALEQRLLGLLRRTLPRDRFPVAFIHIHTDPSEVDWNRHPAKAEIYLRHVSQWQTTLERAVDQALRLAPGAAPLAETARVQTLFKTAEQGAGYGLSRELSRQGLAPDPQINAAASQAVNSAEVNSAVGSIPHALSQSPSSPPPALSSLRAVAQLHNTYIVAEHDAGIWLVEQHIAHERVLYEQIFDRWHCVPLEPPLVMEGLGDRQLHQLRQIGVELDSFGEGLWAIRSAPALLAQRSDCAEALLELSQGGDLQAAQVATACRSAIRNGTPLSLGEMQALLDQWQRTRQPRTCPHGRPIYMVLAETSLARFFRRHWVIGKSHGI
ncbi:MAG: DNA mismatch repair endonuclease MutL [Synechococcales cyanobacterium RM1_1_8]|nr:DNA mismatch repair endonuclease MutL [Synechococcales cyanobacterium RM1_1_8]